MDANGGHAILYVPTGRETNDLSVHTVQIPLEHGDLQCVQNIPIDRLCGANAGRYTVDEQSVWTAGYGKAILYV